MLNVCKTRGDFEHSIAHFIIYASIPEHFCTIISNIRSLPVCWFQILISKPRDLVTFRVQHISLFKAIRIRLDGPKLRNALKWKQKLFEAKAASY